MMPTEHDMEALATAFATLGRLHREPPSEQVLAAIRELKDEWPLPSTAASEQGLAQWRESELSGETAEAIRADHDRLYGDSATAIVPPYESVHRGVDRLVFDSETLEVRRFYASLGLQAPALNREPDDHLGLEFDFLSQGILLALDAEDTAHPGREEILSVLRGFLHDHVLVWAPQMLSAVAANANTAFMTGLAELSSDALEAAKLSFD